MGFGFRGEGSGVYLRDWLSSLGGGGGGGGVDLRSLLSVGVKLWSPGRLASQVVFVAR